jgi:hypothetical protein
MGDSMLDRAALTLRVPSSLAKERIEGRYLPLVQDALVEAGAAGAHPPPDQGP